MPHSVDILKNSLNQIIQFLYINSIGEFQERRTFERAKNRQDNIRLDLKHACPTHIFFQANFKN
jgi:hypothetical protein